MLISIVTSQTIQLPKLITNNMVLQSENPSIFGWTDSSTYVEITGSFTSADGQQIITKSVPTKSTTVHNKASAWTIDFPAQNASFNPIIITLSAPNHPSVSLSNILFGDVYLCSGQSKYKYKYICISYTRFSISYHCLSYI